jgi:HYR domain
VTDAANLTGNCTFTVTVNDMQNPTVSCPANINFTTPGANDPCGVVTYATPGGSDNCAIQSVVCSPASGGCFPVGMTTVTCTATDTSGNHGSCSFKVTVSNPCTITCPGNITKNNDPNQCGAVVTFAPTTTGGGCGAVVCTPASGSFFPKGTTTVTCTTSGPSCSFTVTVNDTEGPHITLTTGTLELWPANHNYTTITMSQLVASVTDNCGGNFINNVKITSVSSDESEDNPGPGDGSTLNDIVIAANCKSVQLRAERDGNLNGRVYTINLKVTDGLGNVTTASRTVVVPLSQSGGGAILGPGPGYTKTSSCP